MTGATGRTVTGTIICNQAGNQATCSGRSNADPTPCPVSGTIHDGGARLEGTFSCPGTGAAAFNLTQV